MIQATDWSISGATKITQPQPTFSETQSSQLRQTPLSPEGNLIPNAGIFLIFIDFAVILAILVFPFLQELSKFKMNSIPFVRASRIPCRNCRFLSSSSYLKCAVHPTTALTEEAIACPDYRPRNLIV
jgi:hypothetical protein